MVSVYARQGPAGHVDVLFGGQTSLRLCNSQCHIMHIWTGLARNGRMAL